MAEKAIARPPRVLFLFTGSRTRQVAKLANGIGHDNQFYGMYRVRAHGIDSDFLEPEQFVSSRVAQIWRRILNIHWMYLPLYPLFFRYDIVFAASAYGLLFIRALFGIRRPRWVMYDMNITGTIGDAHTFKQKLFRFAVSRVDGIVAISKAECDSLKTMFPHLRDRIVFLHEGVDTDFFRPGDIKEEPFVLSVGLDPSRDFSTIVEAVRDTPVELKLATDPARVANISLPSNVSARRYPPEEMLDLYARARLVVIGLNMKGDNNDSMGTFAVIEAMACGKAIIATRTNALASYIKDGGNGRFVPVRDAQTLRNVILELWNDPQTCTKLGKAAQAFVVEHADADIYAEHLAAYFKRVVAAQER